MYIICESCDDGIIHDNDCVFNESFETDNCDCHAIRCPECKGRGKIDDNIRSDKYVYKTPKSKFIDD